MFPDCLQRDMISHCTRGYDMVKIKDDLNIQDPEPEILDQTSLTGAVFRSNQFDWRSFLEAVFFIFVHYQVRA